MSTPIWPKSVEMTFLAWGAGTPPEWLLSYGARPASLAERARIVAVTNCDWVMIVSAYLADMDRYSRVSEINYLRVDVLDVR